MQIQSIKKEIKFKLRLKLAKGNIKVNCPFREVSLQHLVKYCNREAESTREGIEDKSRETNVKCVRKCALKARKSIANGAIKEIIRKVDTIENEM